MGADTEPSAISGKSAGVAGDDGAAGEEPPHPHAARIKATAGTQTIAKKR